MTDELDNLSDAQLSEIFAVEVANIPTFNDSLGTRRISPIAAVVVRQSS